MQEAICDAREATIVNEMPRVQYLARRLAAKVHSVDVDDLVSVGYLAVVQSYERFVPGKGCEFRTFSTNRVNGAFKDYLRSIDPLTRDHRATVGSSFTATVSFANESDEQDDGPRMDAIASETFDVVRALLHSECASAIVGCNPRNHEILERFFFKDETLQVIADALGLSSSRVCQIVKECVARARRRMGVSRNG